MKLLFIFFLTIINFAIGQEPAAKIGHLKELQLHASLHEYSALEQQIKVLYKQENVTYPKDTPWFIFISHAAPRIVWQLLFLVAWWFALLGVWWLVKRRLLFLMLLTIMGTTGFFVAVGYYELHTNYFIVPNHTTILRLGPGNNYAQRMPLEYLAPVIIKQQQGDWLLVDYNGMMGWFSISGS